jgi:L,D-peptidoglycan transpeptidase YkuD (ErfK/YbiS/YcfS/YnhG family)
VFDEKRERKRAIGKKAVISAIVMRKSPGDGRRGRLWADGRVFNCALGRGGMRAVKREGDGATPIARMRLMGGFFRPDRIKRPRSALPFRAIGPSDGWCDAPADPNYNRLVSLPFRASHERMTRDDELYDICLVLDWNLEPHGRRRFGGSAIFLHIAKPGFPPTEGCIAVRPEAMRWLLPRIGRETVVRVVA